MYIQKIHCTLNELVWDKNSKPMSLLFKVEISFKFGPAQELWGSEYQAAPAVVVFIGV